MTSIQKAREALGAARDAIALHRAYTALPSDRGGKFGPKGKAFDAWREAEARAEGCVSRALAALDAETEVKVRELEWERLSNGNMKSRFAEFEYRYFVHSRNGRFLLHHASSFTDDEFETEVAAQAAAQADFERRIRSALVSPESRS